jgi:Tfp pilus assembly ATPase PilU
LKGLLIIGQIHFIFPVEYNFMGINQVQMHEEIGLTFASSLRSFLRQDPDIIMVGEIRDFETAQIAIQAALTGHLVLSTVHTNDAPGTISRLQWQNFSDRWIALTQLCELAHLRIALGPVQQLAKDEHAKAWRGICQQKCHLRHRRQKEDAAAVSPQNVSLVRANGFILSFVIVYFK